MIIVLIVLVILVVILKKSNGVSPEDQEYSISTVSIFDLPPFFVGSIHKEWILKQEMDVLNVAQRALQTKRNNCFMIDVGMNDGFFTQVAGAYGCHTYSFELQLACIDIARTAIEANNFTHLITIIRSPVSDLHQQTYLLGHGDISSTSRCDGGFSVSGREPEKKGHKPFQVIGHHKLHTVALDSIVPPKVIVDYLKIDCEGLDIKVIAGADQLFREKRIARASIEIKDDLWPETDLKSKDFHAWVNNSIIPYQKLFSYGYQFKCVNQRGTVLFERWREIVLSGKCTDWEIYI